VFDSALPKAGPPTLYARIGEGHTALVLAAIFLIGTIKRRRPAM